MKKGTFNSLSLWSGFLFVVSGLYLVYELIFNSRIVDGATGEFSPEQMEALELQGRFLSGVGLSLLCLRFVKLSSVKSFLLQVSIITTLAFSFMFFGQKLLIEFLVNNSTQDDRVNAQHVALLKKGIMDQHVVLEDLSIPADAVGTPGTKAMMSIVGAMVFGSNDFIQKLKDSADEIVEQAAKNDAQLSLPDAYEAYQAYQKKVNEQWLAYVDGVSQYEDEKGQIHQKALTKLNEIYEEAGRGFQEKVKTAHDKEALIRTSLEIKRAVRDYFDSKALADKRCSDYESLEQKCHIKIENTYRDTVIEKAGRYVPPNYWCYPEEEMNVSKMVRGRKISTIEKVQDCDSMDREWFEQKLLDMTGGDTNMATNTKVADKVRAELADNGIVMPASWRMSDRQALLDKLIEKGNTQLDTEYRAAITERAGVYLPPTLTQDEFVVLPLVQGPIKEKLEWQHDKPVPLTLDPDAFFERLHAPRYIAPIAQVKDALLNEGKAYGDGQPNEEKGKAYYRSIIVPPFAMSFSLFFGLLNLFSFSATLMGTVTKKAITGKLIAWGTLGIVFVAYPLTFSSDAVKSEAFDYFASEIKKESSPAVSHLAAWVIDTQPIMYPVGNALSKMAGQEHIEQWLLGFVHSESSPTNSSTPDPVRLGGDAPNNNDTVNIQMRSDTTVSNDDRNLPSDSESLSTERNSEYYALSSPSVTSPSHSLSLLREKSQEGYSALVNVSPIGDPANEDWVVYDSKIVKSDVCIIGKQHRDTLYHLRPSAWRSARHGACDSESESDRLPSLGAMLRAVDSLPGNKPVIIEMHESVTSEVYCNRYTALMENVKRTLASKPVYWSTPSRSVLGCLSNVHDVPVYFHLPKYANETDVLKADNHNAASTSEWRRLKQLERGAVPTLSTLPVNMLREIVSEAPYVDGFIIDKPLSNDSVLNYIKSQNKTALVGPIDGVIKRQI